jgi:hypothetical protein
LLRRLRLGSGLIPVNASAKVVFLLQYATLSGLFHLAIQGAIPDTRHRAQGSHLRSSKSQAA